VKGGRLKLPRRRFLHLAAGAAALPTISRIGWTEAYPSRPVRLVTGFAAAGGSDVVARLIGQWLSERFGQSFIIENRPGAGGNIGTESVVRAPPDGYTLLLVTFANVVNASLYKKLNFNFIRDISPVAGLMRVPDLMAIHPSVPARTVPEFIAYAKANAGKITMASAGNGSSGHLAGELLKMMVGISLVHAPYRGNGPALTDLLGGQVELMFPTSPSVVEYVKSGRLRGLAVTTASRSETLPDLPTVSEFVPGYEVSGLYGIGAPKGTPAEFIATINKESNAALANPKMKARFVDLGGIVIPGSPADFGKVIVEDTEKWAKVIEAANIKIE
jgi:tripartite-type tricarboxylate transporter receptor subunit TctC